MSTKQSNPKVEICAYSLISVLSAEKGRAHRVELCASPWEGGTTPSSGLVRSALELSTIEIHAMLRPRGGDFCYSQLEKDTMKFELEELLRLGVHGVVVGALLPNGDPDVAFLREIKQLAGSTSVTCHRAIDVARDTLGMVEVLADLGFQRILSSGQKNQALDGLETLASMVQIANQRIEIMAGSGVNSKNCLEFIKIGCNAVHLSARKVVPGQMEYRKPGISMGGVEAVSEFDVFFSDEAEIRATVYKVDSSHSS